MRIGVVGAGAWGTTMAIHVARKGHEVVLWTRDTARAARMQEVRENEKYLPSIRFP
ncbi:MAG: 2-dehydropantoate 2-reductase N-terminal domain-containing protein, partial [Planctomycetota bacterium]